MERKRKLKGKDWTGHTFDHGVVLANIAIGKWEVSCSHCDKTHVYETRSLRNNSHTKKCEHQKPHNYKYVDRYDGILRRTYGITLACYEDMHKAQKGLCAICGRPDEVDGRRLAVDHNHDTGEVRGLLCGPCNRALGLLQDSTKVLENASKYLTKYANAN